jgi:predicted amidophosphoribosyltransferase
MRSAGKGFEATPGGSDRVAVFADLDEQAIITVTSFLDYYSRAVCIGVNRHLARGFTQEIDFCMTLDFNKSGPQGSRTQIGEWEYQAKYRRSAEATAELLTSLCVGFRWLPWRHIPKPRLITHVPCAPREKSNLPRALAEAVVAQSREAFWGTRDPLLHAELKVRKQSVKNLKVSEKIAHWGRLVETTGISLSRSARACSIVVIDDLYQSGVSLWSFAKYLKAQGAACVVGLVCVKSLRDTDNQ